MNELEQLTDSQSRELRIRFERIDQLQAYPDAFTLIDLQGHPAARVRPARQGAHADLVRTITVSTRS